ncbi:hypothetical protein J2S19_003300 [Metabacillus malikii]|uniref:Uncharacterized protein n=1 Tax=Metabacillus malikii TaxID=1504265 RepID=A0ABT9ZIA4_9BACI|nr:hypothetical protein [Metabacillus malikii]
MIVDEIVLGNVSLLMKVIMFRDNEQIYLVCSW